MERKAVSGIMLALLLIGMLTSAFNLAIAGVNKTASISPTSTSSVPPVTQWNKTYGGAGDDAAFCVQLTDDGGYILAGETDSFGAGDRDFWLVKTDWAGNLQWSKTYGGASADSASYVGQTRDGGYIIAGMLACMYIWLVKTDANGNMQWSRTYDYQYSVGFGLASDGGYILAEVTLGKNDTWGVWQITLVKLDAWGNVEWNETLLRYPEIDGIEHVEQVSDGGYIIVGRTYSSSGFGALLVKADAGGNLQWFRTYGEGDNIAVSGQQTSDGGYILAGRRLYYGEHSEDVWLVKTNAFGNIQWSRTYVGPGDASARDVRQTSDGGYILAGEASFGAGGLDFYLVKTDALGNMQWNTTYGGSMRDMAWSVREVGGGGYVVAGFTNSFGPYPYNYDFWLIKVGVELVINGVFQPVQVVWQDDPIYGDNMTRLDFGVWNARFPMVQGKNTLLFGYPYYGSSYKICFNVTNNYEVQKSFTLKFRVMPDNKVIYESEIFHAPPGQTKLPPLFTPIPYSNVLKKPIPFQFKNAGPATIEVEVVPAAGSEPIESNKVIIHVTVKDTRSLSILYVGMRFPWDSRPIVNMGRATDFMLGTYPIAESDIRSHTAPQIIVFDDLITRLRNQGRLNRSPWRDDVQAAILRYFAVYGWLGRADRVVIIVPNGWPANFGESWTGLAWPAQTRGAVFVVEDHLTTVAHEIGHTYNLPVITRDPGEEYDYDPATGQFVVVGNFAPGYWVNEGSQKETSVYCFMAGRTHAPESLDRWICKHDYSHLLLREFSLTPDPEVLGVSGLIFKNNSAVFDPCYRIPEATPDLTAEATGNYSIVFLDNVGTVLSQIGFNVTFMKEMGETIPMNETHVAPFAFKIPWMADTNRIELRNATDHVLAYGVVSLNPPSITVTYPNGGEVLTPDVNYTITWEASDEDGDPLTYAILYSEDNGTSWLPLAIDYKETSYVWNVTGFRGGSNYLVKVIATDGVNTGEDVSDDNFTVFSHDIAIVNITPCSPKHGLSLVTECYSTWTININVTVENECDFIESFTVQAFYGNSTGNYTIGISPPSYSVTLAPGASTTKTFTWDVPLPAKVYPYWTFTIYANVSVVAGETDTADNIRDGAVVTVRWLGDASVPADGKVNIFDLTKLAKSWKKPKTHAEYNPLCDFARDDGEINIFDLTKLALNWKKGPIPG